MSYKAIWKNRNKPRKCSSNKSVCGTMFGWGIPGEMVEYQTFMLIRNPDNRLNKYGGYSDNYILHVPEYRKLMTQEEADKLDIESGRAVPYFRNSCGFVQSRAARKRGYVSTDLFYNRKTKKKWSH